MKVYKPVNKANKLNGGFTSSHKGYDFDDEPDNSVYCNLIDATVISLKQGEERHWIANTLGDPWYVKGKVRALKSEDYGNYIKIKGKSLEGVTCYSLFAHLINGSIKLRVGQTVPLGTKLGEIGLTGNTTGKHTHYEVRDINEKSVITEFVEFSSNIEDMTENEKLLITELKSKGLNLDDEGAIRGAIDRYVKYPEQQQEFDKYKESVEKFKEEVKLELLKLTDISNGWKKQYQDFIANVAKKIGTVQEEVVILPELDKLVADEQRLKDIEDSRPVGKENILQTLINAVATIIDIWKKEKSNESLLTSQEEINSPKKTSKHG